MGEVQERLLQENTLACPWRMSRSLWGGKVDYRVFQIGTKHENTWQVLVLVSNWYLCSNLRLLDIWYILGPSWNEIKRKVGWQEVFLEGIPQPFLSLQKKLNIFKTVMKSSNCILIPTVSGAVLNSGNSAVCSKRLTSEMLIFR